MPHAECRGAIEDDDDDEKLIQVIFCKVGYVYSCRGTRHSQALERLGGNDRSYHLSWWLFSFLPPLITRRQTDRPLPLQGHLIDLE